MILLFKQPWPRLIIFTTCILLFSLFIQYPFPLRSISLFCIIALGFIIATEPDIIQALTGENKDRYTTLLWTSIAIVASVVLAITIRNEVSQSRIPAILGIFTLVAMIIGSIEEFLFRGWLFSQFRGWTVWPAVIITSIAHAAYKSLLFTSPYLPYEVDRINLFMITFQAGIFLGLTRLFSKSVWPAVVAHALFDLLIYGDQPIPWWVF